MSAQTEIRLLICWLCLLVLLLAMSWAIGDIGHNLRRIEHALVTTTSKP